MSVINFSDSGWNLFVIILNVFYADYERAYKFCTLLVSCCCFSSCCSVTEKPGIVSRNARTWANMYRRTMNCMSLSWKLPSADHGLWFLHPVKSAQNARKVLGVYKKRTLTLKKKEPRAKRTSEKCKHFFRPHRPVNIYRTNSKPL